MSSRRTEIQDLSHYSIDAEEINVFDIVSSPSLKTADFKWKFFDDTNIKELSKKLLTKYLREKRLENILK